MTETTHRFILSALVTTALGACAIVLVVRGDVPQALTFAALLMPSIGQSLLKPGNATATATAVEVTKP